MPANTPSYSGMRNLLELEAYLFGSSAVVAATMLRLLAQPVIGNAAPYLLYILPIMGAAAYGGFAPGLFTTLLSALAIVFVFLHHPALIVSNAYLVFLFLLDGLWISWLGEQMRLAINAAESKDKETRAIRERERRILDSVSDAFGALDANWQLTYANKNLARLARRPLEEVLSKEIWEVLPELAEAGPKRELHRALQEQTSVRLETFLPCLNRWYETTAYPLEGGLSVFSRDITDRKHSEEMLREREERLRLAPEAARVGTWADDLTRKRVICSAELEQIVGLASGSFAGTEDAFFQIIHPEDRNKVREVIQSTIEHGNQYEMEFRYVHASGETRWMLSRGEAYFDPSGLPLRLAGIGIDITEQKRSEEKLRHTQKLESLGVLAGGIAHDFNNLLVCIVGNASLASASLPVGHTARSLLKEIELAGEKGAHLTGQMLAYAGKGRSVIERLQLRKLVLEIECLIRSSIPKNVDLRLDSKMDLPSIEADHGQMQQLIMNLVINAAESIPKDRSGTVLVQTRLQQVDEQFIRTHFDSQEIAPGNYLILEVHDNGIGMDEATKARIFEPFFTTKFMGRGLGLAAALGIVRGHKGALNVESVPGRGSTFHVLLPAVPGTEQKIHWAATEAERRAGGFLLSGQ